MQISLFFSDSRGRLSLQVYFNICADFFISANTKKYHPHFNIRVVVFLFKKSVYTK